MELGLANLFNRSHLRRNGHDQELAARIKTFETAFRMQFEATEAFDISRRRMKRFNCMAFSAGTRRTSAGNV